jgi:hypothetical protein
MKQGHFISRWVFALNCLFGLLCPSTAFAWGYQSHEVVGSVADQLLNPNAKQQVRHILDIARPELRIAGPWADCVKSVVRTNGPSRSTITSPTCDRWM